jgi:dihydrofolate reductase
VQQARTAEKVLWHVMMSLDAFIAGADHEMEWAFEYPHSSAMADEVMNSTGAILAGRRWFDVATERYEGRAGIYGGKWTGPVFVLTHRELEHDVSDPGITLLAGDIESAVATVSAAADGRAVGIFGADIARQCLEAGLLDEIVVHVAPLLLGDGIRLYGGPGFPRVDLERTALEESGQLTSMRFRVVN